VQNNQEASEIIADYTLSRIPLEVRSSFTEEQLLAIRKALIQQSSSGRHRIAIRLTLPLFFRKYYFAFFFGRDRRRRTVDSENSRIQKTPKLIRNTIVISFLTIFTLGFVLAVLAALYLLKYALGIDIFPDSHLRDMAAHFLSVLEPKR
jgi:hypothetical protein